MDENSGESIFLEPPCFYCQHLIEIGTQENEDHIEEELKNWTCKAFPSGIPRFILKRYMDHNEPALAQEDNYVFESKVFVDEETGLKQKITFEGEWIAT